MRLDHLLSREIRPIERIAASLEVSSVQHPAPGAPAPRHLDSRTAKRSESKTTRGRGDQPPAPENESFLNRSNIRFGFFTIAIIHLVFSIDLNDLY